MTANVAPDQMAEVCQVALAGDADRANDLNSKLMGLHKGLFVESNPIPVKWALHQMGKIGKGIRLPLTELSGQYHDIVRDALAQAGIGN